MIFTDKILIPVTCPLNFNDKAYSDQYTIRDYCQKWCNSDTIRVQVRSDYYSSGLTLKVFDDKGIYRGVANFDTFTTLSDGYDYSNCEYEVDLADGFYYFCICDGDTWLAQSSFNYIGKNNNTFLLEYQNDKNVLETIFDDSLNTSNSNIQTNDNYLLLYLRDVNINYIEGVNAAYQNGCSISPYYDPNQSIINGNTPLLNSSYVTHSGYIEIQGGTVKFIGDTVSIDSALYEFETGLFFYGIDLATAENKTGYFIVYNSISEEIGRTKKIICLAGNDGYIKPHLYIENSINVLGNDEGIIPNLIISCQNDVLIANDCLNISYFTNIDEYYIELYDKNDNLLDTQDFGNIYRFGTINTVFDATVDGGEFYIKAYYKQTGWTDAVLVAESPVFYVLGDAVYDSADGSEDIDFSTSFYFRCEGGIKPNGDSPKINSTDFSDQEDEVIPLHQNPYQTYTLTIGDNNGIPIEFREKLNHILALNQLRYNFLDITKASEVKTFEAEDIDNTGSKILKVDIQPTINDHAQTGIIVLTNLNELLNDTEYLTL